MHLQVSSVQGTVSVHRLEQQQTAGRPIRFYLYRQVARVYIHPAASWRAYTRTLVLAGMQIYTPWQYLVRLYIHPGTSWRVHVHAGTRWCTFYVLTGQLARFLYA